MQTDPGSVAHQALAAMLPALRTIPSAEVVLIAIDRAELQGEPGQRVKVAFSSAETMERTLLLDLLDASIEDIESDTRRQMTPRLVELAKAMVAAAATSLPELVARTAFVLLVTTDVQHRAMLLGDVHWEIALSLLRRVRGGTAGS